MLINSDNYNRTKKIFWKCVSLPDYHHWLDRFQRWDGNPGVDHPIPLKATQNSSETEFRERSMEDYEKGLENDR